MIECVFERGQKIFSTAWRTQTCVTRQSTGLLRLLVVIKVLFLHRLGTTAITLPMYRYCIYMVCSCRPLRVYGGCSRNTDIERRVKTGKGSNGRYGVFCLERGAWPYSHGGVIIVFARGFAMDCDRCRATLRASDCQVSVFFVF